MPSPVTLATLGSIMQSIPQEALARRAQQEQLQQQAIENALKSRSLDIQQQNVEADAANAAAMRAIQQATLQNNAQDDARQQAQWWTGQAPSGTAVPEALLPEVRKIAGTQLTDHPAQLPSLSFGRLSPQPNMQTPPMQGSTPTTVQQNPAAPPQTTFGGTRATQMAEGNLDARMQGMEQNFGLSLKRLEETLRAGAYNRANPPISITFGTGPDGAQQAFSVPTRGPQAGQATPIQVQPPQPQGPAGSAGGPLQRPTTGGGGGAAGQPGVGDLYADERGKRVTDEINNLMQRTNPWTVGWGSLLSGVPTSDARAYRSRLDSLKANISFNELTEMRAASKTGGALGQVSDTEGRLLASALAGLDQAVEVEDMKAALTQAQQVLERWYKAKAQFRATQQPNRTLGAPQMPQAPQQNKFGLDIPQTQF